MGSVAATLALVEGLEVETVESSCCGMAGAFGYGADTYAASIAMAELSLLPAVRGAAPETLLAANGFSCRHQIQDGTGRRPRHIARIEVLLERARQLVRAFDIKAYWQINHDLHFLIGGLIGNSALQVMWDRFYFQAARMWYDLARELGREVSRSLIREIEDVLEAARDGDVRAIGYIQRTYIAYGLRHVVARYEEPPRSP